MKISPRQAQLRLVRSVLFQAKISTAILSILAEMASDKGIDPVKLGQLAKEIEQLNGFNDQLLKELDEDQAS